jgi:hypothetical protein
LTRSIASRYVGSTFIPAVKLSPNDRRSVPAKSGYELRQLPG